MMEHAVLLSQKLRPHPCLPLWFPLPFSQPNLQDQDLESPSHQVAVVFSRGILLKQLPYL